MVPYALSAVENLLNKKERYRCVLMVFKPNGKIEVVKLEYYPPEIVIKSFLRKGTSVSIFLTLSE